jgi:hypothetical protein
MICIRPFLPSIHSSLHSQFQIVRLTAIAGCLALLLFVLTASPLVIAFAFFECHNLKPYPASSLPVILCDQHDRGQRAPESLASNLLLNSAGLHYITLPITRYLFA